MGGRSWRIVRRLPVVLATVLAGIVASACGLITGLNKNGLDDLTDQRLVWKALDLRDYEYVVRHDCHCYRAGQLLRVVVRDGVRQTITVLETGEQIPDNGVYTLNGVEGLFEALRQAYLRRAIDVDVVYDETWHYPRAAYVDEAKQYTHDDRRWVVTSFTPAR